MRMLSGHRGTSGGPSPPSSRSPGRAPSAGGSWTWAAGPVSTRSWPAQLGLDVTGIDLDEAALLIAGRKLAERGLTARFLHLDARRLTELDGEPFGTVTDCELFHILDGADRAEYVHGLGSGLRPGGRYFMLCYSDAQPDVPHRVSLGDILAAFAAGWRIDSIEPATIDTNVHHTGVRGWLAALTRTCEDAPC